MPLSAAGRGRGRAQRRAAQREAPQWPLMPLQGLGEKLAGSCFVEAGITLVAGPPALVQKVALHGGERWRMMESALLLSLHTAWLLASLA